MTTRNIWNHPNFRKDILDRTRRYIAFTTSSSSMKKYFTIFNNGQVIQTDEHDFIKNPHDLGPDQRAWMFFSTNEDKLQEACILATFDNSKRYIEAQVWKTRFNYVSENLVVLARLMEHLDRTEVRLQYVTKMDRNDKPEGQIKIYHRSELIGLKTRAVPLF